MGWKERYQELATQWYWEPAPRKAIASLTVGGGLLAGICGVAVAGSTGAWLFGFAGIALMFWGMHTVVGNKVAALARELPAEAGRPVQGVIVHGAIEAPGVAVLNDESLILRTIVGKHLTVPRSEIKSVRRVQIFNGSAYGYKSGLWFDAPGHERLGVCIPKPVAASWAAAFTPGSRRVRRR